MNPKKYLSDPEQNWNDFWDIVEEKPLFLKLLYAIHFQKYKELLSKITLFNPKILELGAGTGVLAQRLLELYGGEAVLVDNNPKAYELFEKYCRPNFKVTYLKKNFFNLEIGEKFDLVFSDGLIEHFKEKKQVLEIHKKYINENGHIFFFVPHASWLFRLINRIGPKACRSKLFSKKDLMILCRENNLKIVNFVEYFFELGVLCKKA